MKEIILLNDYKGNFGSKAWTKPYRGGFDKKLLTQFFAEAGYTCRFLCFSDVNDLNESLAGKVILYTSSEDIGYHYKDFIEDVVLYCEKAGAHVIPSYDHLRANNNKVYMELFRRNLLAKDFDNLKSSVFGSLEELLMKVNEISYPVVIKESQGAQSTGVYLAANKGELIKKVKSFARTPYISEDLRDKVRAFKHKDYVKESLYRRKFILQEFAPDLKNDWKIIVYGKRYLILTRHTKKDDFRASGSHTNYLPGTKSLMPEGIFEFAEKVFEKANVPQLSLDVIQSKGKFYLTEFQSVYFGTSTFDMSDAYFVKEGNRWVPHKKDIPIEKLYTDSILTFLQKH